MMNKTLSSIAAIVTFFLPFLLAASIPAWSDNSAGHAGIAIPFHLREAGYVTLVIDDSSGKRVRNLVSETQFSAGDNVVWWDGLDDLGRDPDAAAHAIYHIPAKLVLPGKYTVRGLYRKALDVRYEFTVYNPGNPPWQTKDTGSEWLANHTPPSAVLAIPAGAAPRRLGALLEPSPAQVLIGSYVTEGGSGLAWVDLDGHKLHGQGWVGGVWTGSELLARDTGDHPVPGNYAYSVSAWGGDKYNGNMSEIRLHALISDLSTVVKPLFQGNSDTRFGYGEDPAVLQPTYKFPDKASAAVSGLAVHDGIIAVSLPKMSEILFVDAAAHKALAPAAMDDPRGLAYDAQGRLLVLSATTLTRYTVNIGPTPTLTDPRIVIQSGLQDAQQLTLDTDGNIYVSDWGTCHQVHVFSPTGAHLRNIGDAGAPKAGPYDMQQMHHPNQITIDARGNLWVAETDTQPKRVSVWGLDGKFIRAFYGPMPYGGGGVLDGADKTKMYALGMEFKLDWTTGASEPSRVTYRPGDTDLRPSSANHDDGGPDTPIHAHGSNYWTNCFTSNPTNGVTIAMLWIDKNGVAVPTAAIGRANDWDIFKGDAFKSSLPPGTDLANDGAHGKATLFAWSDKNGDGQVTPDEVTFQSVPEGGIGSVMVMPDLTVLLAQCGDAAVRFDPVGYATSGAPLYDIQHPATLIPGAQRPVSSGGGQVLIGKGGWTILTTAPKPYAPQGIGGGRDGVATWSYPSLWPGLHASHNAAMPEYPGELIGTTRLIGYPIDLPGKQGQLWAVNGNQGNIYLFTTDGLFVATLFQDCRYPSASWANVPKAVRDMSIGNQTLGAECFWPSITQTSDGNVYVQCGVASSAPIARIDGLDTIERLPDHVVSVTPVELAAAQADFEASEAARQKSVADEPLVVSSQVTVTGTDANPVKWANANWVTVDKRVNQVGNWGHQPELTKAAIAISGDRIHVAYMTDEPNMPVNSGVSPQNLFKTGGGLDLMLDASGGPERLLVAQVAGKTVAMLYRLHDPTAKSGPVQFTSPIRTVTFDRVDDVSDQVTLAADKKGFFEFSAPAALLGLDPAAQTQMKADIGVLRGDGIQTLQRVYWHNKATGLVSDVPSEADLTPQLWGVLRFDAK